MAIVEVTCRRCGLMMSERAANLLTKPLPIDWLCAICRRKDWVDGHEPHPDSARLDKLERLVREPSGGHINLWEFEKKNMLVDDLRRNLVGRGPDLRAAIDAIKED